MSKVPMVRSVWPRVIVRDLRKHGKDVGRILGESGLDLRTINREGGRIPWEKQARLMEIVARELGVYCYGHISLPPWTFTTLLPMLSSDSPRARLATSSAPS